MHGKISNLDELRLDRREDATEDVPVHEECLFETLGINPIVIAGVRMSHDEPYSVVAVHRRAARRVAHGSVEEVHAVTERSHVREHPEPVVALELDDQSKDRLGWILAVSEK